MASDCSPLFFGFAGAILAGFERSDCENKIKMCMRPVTTAKPKVENATPFQDDSNEDHCRNFTKPTTIKQAQDSTTCSQHEIDRALEKQLYKKWVQDKRIKA